MEARVKPPRLIRNGRIQKALRVGRGFSLKELEEAGISLRDACKLGIPIDKRRRSKHKWNVEALKNYLRGLDRS